MPLDILMPKLGLTMTEGVLLEWKTAPGDKVKKGQILYVVETDKAATDIEAQDAGVLAEQVVGEGETVAVGTVVGRLIGDGNTDAKPDATDGNAKEKKSGESQAERAHEKLAAQGQSGKRPASRASRRIVATPLARRLAREKGIALDALEGSGPRGRIKAVDVERAVKDGGNVPFVARSGETARLKPSSTQAAMAKRLAAVKHGVPHFYLASEVEVSALLELREALNADSQGARLSLNDFILAAVGRTLGDIPAMNRVWSDGDILAFAETDVSMAVETDKGLFVPVVRGAGSKPIDEIAGLARRLAQKARSGDLNATEMEGGAIAVSNAGMHDVTWLTPIINPGQSAIVGVGSVREIFRPDDAGMPALQREMGLVFSGDHRVHTGVEGLAFLNRVKDYLQNPLRLLRHGQTFKDAQ